jgi:hypothetical protein
LNAAGNLKHFNDFNTSSTSSGVLVGDFGDYLNPWVPTTISAALWYDASDTSSITGVSSVTGWNDKSGSGYDLTGENSPTTNSTTLNGLNVIDFGNSVNSKSLYKDGDGTQNWQDVYIVLRYDGGTTFTEYLGIITGYNLSGTDGGRGLIGNAGQNYYYSQTWSDTRYINGTQLVGTTLLPALSSASILSISANSAISVDGFEIGKDGRNGSRGWRGIFAEIVAFNSKLSDSEREKVEGYLAWKWGLVTSLPSAHTYKTSSIGIEEVGYPLLTSVMASDPNNDLIGVDTGDDIVFTFDGNTNAPNVSTKLAVDSLIDFGANVLGSDYTGAWNIDGNVLTVTVIDAAGNAMSIGQDISIKVSGNLTYTVYGPRSSSNLHLTGDFGPNTSDNLFLWWALDETSGTTASDSSTQGRTGSLSNGQIFSGNSVSAAVGTGLLLDEYLDYASAAALTLASGNGYAYSLWAKYNWGSEDSLDTEPVIEGTAGFVWASGNLFYHKSAYHQLTDTSYVTTPMTGTLSANTWYHIAATYNGNTISLYLDGVFQSSNTAISWANTSEVRLTNPGVQTSGNSSLDQLKFYNEPLSAVQIQSLYLEGSP